MPTKIEHRTSVAYCLHDDTNHIQSSLIPLADDADPSPASVFVSHVRWHGTLGDWQSVGACQEPSDTQPTTFIWDGTDYLGEY